MKHVFEPLFQRTNHRLSKTSLTTNRKYLAKDASEAPTTYNKRENAHPTTNMKTLYEQIGIKIMLSNFNTLGRTSRASRLFPTIRVFSPSRKKPPTLGTFSIQMGLESPYNSAIKIGKELSQIERKKIISNQT